MIPITLDVLVMTNNTSYSNLNIFSKKKNIFFFFYNYLFNINFLFIFDFAILNILNILKTKENNYFFIKVQQLKNKYLFNMKIGIKNFYFYEYLLLVIKNLSIWLISIFFCISIFFYLSNIRSISFNKVLFEWFLIVMFLYWLLSGFTFFIKKYQFSKFTSVIQRFWRRSYIIFWLIESGVFITFFYLTINSSEEPVYMYDQVKLFKSHFFSWKFFFLKIILNIYLILIMHYLLIAINFTNFKKQNLLIILITLLLLYFLWLEFYQFFHIINFYSNLIWVFDYDEFMWSLEIEFRRTRMSNNYIALCLIAKFWHLIFIFVFWVFFILRINELTRMRYPLFSSNHQNFIILYLMGWLFMYPWLKFFFRGVLDINYYWFMNNTNKNFSRLFVNDLKLFYFGILNFNFDLINFKNISFFYFFESSNTSLMSWKKHFLKDSILNELFNVTV